jgi:hypothetical protein
MTSARITKLPLKQKQTTGWFISCLTAKFLGILLRKHSSNAVDKSLLLGIQAFAIQNYLPTATSPRAK